MKGVGFQLASPSRGSGGKMPLVFERKLAAGYAESQGALVVVNGSNEIAACAADAQTIAGVALGPGGTDSSGFNILGSKEFPPGYLQAISLEDATFLAPYVGALGAVGTSYGFVRDADGVYKVDFNEVATVCLKYLGLPQRSPADANGSGQNQLVLVKFLAAVIQPVA